MQAWDALPGARRPEAAPPPIAAPVPFLGVIERNFEDQWETRRRNARFERTDEELWARHRDLERRLGRSLPLSRSLAGVGPQGERDGLERFMDRILDPEAINAAILGRPGLLEDDAYEALVEAERAKNPAAFEGFETRAALGERLSAEFTATRRRADEAAGQGVGGMAGAFLGQTAGVLSDPAEAALLLGTGGLGAGRGLLTRMATQAGVGAGIEAMEIGQRSSDAAGYGGPAYTAAEAGQNVLFGAAAGAAFEPVGDVLRLGWRAARGGLSSSAEPADRGLADAVDRLFDDEATLGAADDFDGARAALARGEPMPAVEPERDLSELFANQPPGEVSGGVRQMQRGSDRFSFDAAPDGSGRMTWAIEAKGLGEPDADFGAMQNGISGYVEGDSWVVHIASLPESARGQGLAVAMYADAASRAAADGKGLVSDGRRGTSSSAANVWEALRRRGFDVERRADAVQRDDGQWITPDGAPVYRIRSVPRSTREEAPVAALQSTTYYGREIHAGRFDPLAVEVDAARFQYKADGDAEGVTGRLRGVERWDATASGKAILFEDTDGRLIVADGHQRRGLARRLAEQGWEDAQLDGYLFRASDGWTAREVRVVAALKNIREGSGSTLDAAKLFREAPAALNDRSLPISGDLIRQARQLAGLSDDAFRAVVNKVIPEGFGAVIGEQAAGRPEIHADLVELLRRGEPRGAEGARALIQEGMLDDFLASEGRQMDLFGGLPRESTVIARGRIREAVLSGLRRDEKLNAALVRNAEAIEAGGNILARSENEARLAVDRAAGELVSRLALRSGEMGEAFQLAATAVTKGEATPGAAAKGLIARIRAAVAAGEALDEVRAEILTPEAPGAAALKALDAYDQPGGAGQKAQLNDKPEDVDVEAEAASAGLFDDLPDTLSEDRALTVLKACAPGAPA